MVENLRDIAGVDRAWGGSRLLARWLLARKTSGDGRPESVLDLGAGSAVPTGRLRRYLAEAGIDARVYALDLQWRHLAAGARMNGGSRCRASPATPWLSRFEGGSVDWVVGTLLLHHFSPGELFELLREIQRVARRGFALLDLRRHRVPLALVAVSGRFAFRSPVSVHDGIASVRQAYTPDELRTIVSGGAPGARVERVFPFRLLVSFSA